MKPNGIECLTKLGVTNDVSGLLLLCQHESELAFTFYFYLAICIKFIKSFQAGIKILYAFQQDVRYTGNLIHGVRLQMDVRDRLTETFFWYVAAFF